jgi:hypothetical protein
VTLRLDHVFCFVDDPGDAVARAESAGYELDAGITHPGQGTRNRRLVLAEQYLELVWVHDPAEAAANPLGLHRRAAWEETGASPIGIAFLGRPEDTSGYWVYDALGFPIWVREADERAPLVFTLDVPPRDRVRPPLALREVIVGAPVPLELPSFAGPPVTSEVGPHRLELVLSDGRSVAWANGGIEGGPGPG